MTESTPTAPLQSAARDGDASLTTMTEYVLPTHANALGNVFGGQILSWMDLCAAICAQRHCGRIAVTAGIDDLAFAGPIQVGQVVRLRAHVTATFRSSLEVEVVVEGEDATTRRTWPCCSAFLTFVAMGDDRQPAPVPALVLRNDEERARAAAAHERRAARLAKKRG
jgi:acyl-CoA hydrolase